MARGRAPLTDKEEKILIQAQLMGLSTASMVKIGNRLRALEQEREAIANIENTVAGYTWEDLTSGNWKITTPEGHLVEATKTARGKSSWNHYGWNYNIKVSKPGTRFKERSYKEQSMYMEYDWKKRLMPGNSKELYALIRWCARKEWELN